MEPILKLVPLSSIELQEESESFRLDNLVQAINKSGVLKDPPIVTQGINGNLIQIDGTTRISALRKLDCSHIVVQYVDYHDTSQVMIKSWTHVSKVRKDDFIKGLKKIRGTESENFKIGLGVTLTGHPLAIATIIFRDGKGLSIYTNSDLLQRVRLMRKVVDLYSKLITRDREVTIESMSQLSDFFSKHRDKNVALFFPSFSSHDIFSLIKNRLVLPTGITRHIINGRILRINYPISMLKKSTGIQEKQRFFSDYIKKLNLRFYEESVYLVE